MVAKWLAVLTIWGTVALAVVLAFYCYDLPDVRQVGQRVRRPAITLVAADGVRFSRTGELQGEIIDAARLPRHMVNAVLAIEDRRFFRHFGIDPIGLVRAVVVNFRRDHAVQGGSTITQQLAKNLFLSSERRLRRKVQEALLALWLEHLYTKNQILTAYLNRVYLGAGAFGVDAASQTYFGKPITRISLHEAAMLAGMLKAPAHYSPLNNPYESEQRAQVVLSAMVDAGFISPNDAKIAMQALPTPPPPTADGIGRYFANWVSDHVGSYIGADHEDLLVFTTLDLRLQQAAEQKLASLIATNGPQNNVGQGALLALSPDGAVRAMVGGRNYVESPFNRATQALRQPGSSFKPFVYLAALGSGYTPDTVVDDRPLRIGKWQPANYEKGFRGAVPLRDALAHSINTCAVRIMESVGIDRVRTLAQRLGITSPLGRDLSLALGTSEVTLIELVAAYAGLANGGRPVIPHAIREIRDTQGAVLYKRRGSVGTLVADPVAVSELTGMMTGVLGYGTGKAARLDRPAAGKTGTTSDYHDAWFVGFTADYVAGVWLGNDNNDEMKKVTGGSLPAKLWHDFMVEAHLGLPMRPLPHASGVDPMAMAAPQPISSAPAEPAADVGIQGLIERLSGGSGEAYDRRAAGRR
ncbi:MAG: PBP1A family penicillin-binding protein [Rhodospirillaceae bacterium]